MASLTLAQIVDRSRLLFQQAGVPIVPKTIEMNVWANEAQDEWAEKTESLISRTTLAVDATQTPATAFYTVTSGTLRIKSAYDTVNQNKIRIFSVEKLEAINIDWLDDTGNPDALVYGPYGRSLLRVWPYPAAALTGLDVWRVRLPAAMTASQAPQIDLGDHEALIDGTLARGFRKLGITDKAAEWEAEFQRKLQKRIGAKTRDEALTEPIRRRRDF